MSACEYLLHLRDLPHYHRLIVDYRHCLGDFRPRRIRLPDVPHLVRRLIRTRARSVSLSAGLEPGLQS